MRAARPRPRPRSRASPFSPSPSIMSSSDSTASSVIKRSTRRRRVLLLLLVASTRALASRARGTLRGGRGRRCTRRRRFIRSAPSRRVCRRVDTVSACACFVDCTEVSVGLGVAPATALFFAAYEPMKAAQASGTRDGRHGRRGSHLTAGAVGGSRAWCACRRR